MKWRLLFRRDPEAGKAAEQALKTAEADLHRTKQRSAEVTSVTGDIRQYRLENGYSEMFREAIRGI